MITSIVYWGIVAIVAIFVWSIVANYYNSRFKG